MTDDQFHDLWLHLFPAELWPGEMFAVQFLEAYVQQADAASERIGSLEREVFRIERQSREFTEKTVEEDRRLIAAMEEDSRRLFPRIEAALARLDAHLKNRQVEEKP